MKYLIPGLFAFLLSSTGIAQPTFAEDVAEIVYAHCSNCHRQGEIGPMSLTNYEEVKQWAPMIQYVTEIKYMPPVGSRHIGIILFMQKQLERQNRELFISVQNPLKLKNDSEVVPDLAILSHRSDFYVEKAPWAEDASLGIEIADSVWNFYHFA